MKISSILIMALATGALSAQDAGDLEGRIQMFVEQSRPAQIVAFQYNGADINDQAGSQTGVGIRFLGELGSAPGFYYELGGKLDSSSKYTLHGTLPNGNTGDISDVKVTDSYWSLGAAYMPKIGPNGTVGLHLEARGETLNLQGQATINGVQYAESSAVTFLRPWVRVSGDYTFTGIGQRVHPYLGVDGSIALMHTAQTASPNSSWASMDNRTLQSMAPKYAVAAYAGLRF